LIVTCDGNRYAIPQVNLLELVRREKSDNNHGVEMIHGAPVYRLRGNLLPLVYARTALERRPLAENDEEPLHIVVLQADDRSFGLVVDQINDTEEIVVKPMGKQLKGVAAFSGATIMGDGRVALILDVMGLAQRSNVIAGTRDRNRTEQTSASTHGATNRVNLLVLGIDDLRRGAIPLSSVARLEEFPHTSVEHAGQYKVVQYRGEILPLLDLQEILGVPSYDEPTGPLQVVVYSENGRRVGFVVRRIVDIVQDEIILDPKTSREGVLGSMVLQNRVTDVLDMSAIVRSRAPWLLESDLEVAA
ncbi:MAG: chemotaxis protein CheW, partial [Gemmatimonadaceae bacterium]